MLDEYRKGLASLQDQAGLAVNGQAGVFTFVHLAETREQAIRNGAAWSALWYVNAAPVVFKVPRSVWYDMIKAGLHPNSARSTEAIQTSDPTGLEIEADDPEVLVLLKRMARGETISFAQAHEVLEALDCVIIGDPDHCRRKIQGYEAIGADRLMCLMQFGSIPHAAVMRSIELAGEHLTAEVKPTSAQERAPLKTV
jgi:alkanesulfonate monooxygenase SsuD/methylene tetrahydromethanopterin reductase-like flavin-dependent oxidoreductase (luciferase family)